MTELFEEIKEQMIKVNEKSEKIVHLIMNELNGEPFNLFMSSLHSAVYTILFLIEHQVKNDSIVDRFIAGLHLVHKNNRKENSEQGKDDE